MKVLRRLCLGVVASSALLMAPAISFAQNLVANFTDDALVGILRGEGYSPEIIKPSMIRFKSDGRTYVLFNQKDGDLQLYYGISGGKISFETINKWNSEKRLSRAYNDKDGDPTLEADLLSNGGMTPKHVSEFVSVFKTSANAFREFVIQYKQ